MLEIVEADKQLMICWQKPGVLIDAYTRDFKEKVDMCKAVGSTIGISNVTTKLGARWQKRTTTYWCYQTTLTTW